MAIVRTNSAAAGYASPPPTTKPLTVKKVVKKTAKKTAPTPGTVTVKVPVKKAVKKTAKPAKLTKKPTPKTPVTKVVKHPKKSPTLATGGGRPKGLTTGLGVEAAWRYIFDRNESVPKAKKLTDEQITQWMIDEFGGRKSAIYQKVGAVRSKYNTGRFGIHNMPTTPSQRYDINGNVLPAYARSSIPKGSEAAPVKKAVKVKKATPKKVVKKAVTKKTAPAVKKTAKKAVKKAVKKVVKPKTASTKKASKAPAKKAKR